jgi:hypothetical protein
MSSRPKSTTSLEEIRQWAESRGGYPAIARRDDGGGADSVEIVFSGVDTDEDDKPEEISWDEFYRRFSQANLKFVYQEKTPSGKLSHLWKFVDRVTGLTEWQIESTKYRLPRRSMPSGRGRKAA